MFKKCIVFLSVGCRWSLPSRAFSFGFESSGKSPHRLAPPRSRGESRFFLDTADVKEWESLLPLGIFHGITTNPTILQRCGVPCTIESIHKLAALALEKTDEFMCQSWGDDAEKIYQTGLELSAPDRERIVIKCPVTTQGTKAAAALIGSVKPTMLLLKAASASVSFKP